MDFFVARQPIFDLKGEVVGYELLYRRSAQSRAADGESRHQMAVDVVIQSFAEIGLDGITDGKLAFINFSREMLLDACYDLLDPKAVIIELLETVEVDAQVIAACEQLANAGYRLALDDYESDGGHAPLLPFAQIVKLDVLGRSAEEIGAAVEPLRNGTLRLLAERVETAEVRDVCRELGFELFQGYFFSRPEVITGKGSSFSEATVIQLMRLLHDTGTSDLAVEGAFRRDPMLSYKLLRMANAAGRGGRGIESIMHAIHLLGRETIGRWLMLLLASSYAAVSGVNLELAQSAIVRARLCELLSTAAGQRSNSGPLFMVGLLSRMDVLLGTSMQELLGKIPVSQEVRSALLERKGPYANWLTLVEAYEKGDWNEVTRIAPSLRLSAEAIAEVYLQSISWTRLQLNLDNE